jgi:hypothetical protein
MVIATGSWCYVVFRSNAWLAWSLHSRSSRKYECLARLQCRKSFSPVPPLTGRCPFVVPLWQMAWDHRYSTTWLRTLGKLQDGIMSCPVYILKWGGRKRAWSWSHEVCARRRWDVVSTLLTSGSISNHQWRRFFNRDTHCY